MNPARHVELASGKAPKAVVWTPARVDLWQRTGTRYPVAVWTPEQAGGFLDFVEYDRLYGLWHVIAYRGLRRGEAVTLAWADIDLDDRLLRVAGTKSYRSARTITLDQETVPAPAAHIGCGRCRSGSRGAQRGSTVDGSASEMKGPPCYEQPVSDRFDRLVINSQMPPIPLHDLRHAAASLTYRATRDLKLVSALMGHSGIQITGDIYTSIFEEVGREAAEAMARLVPRTPGSRSRSSACPPGAQTRRRAAVSSEAAGTKTQVRTSGAGGARTHARGIMSTCGLSAVLLRV